jgi:hypothetical protein
MAPAPLYCSATLEVPVRFPCLKTWDELKQGPFWRIMKAWGEGGKCR